MLSEEAAAPAAEMLLHHKAQATEGDKECFPLWTSNQQRSDMSSGEGCLSEAIKCKNKRRAISSDTDTGVLPRKAPEHRDVNTHPAPWSVTALYRVLPARCGTGKGAAACTGCCCLHCCALAGSNRHNHSTLGGTAGAGCVKPIALPHFLTSSIHCTQDGFSFLASHFS